MAANGLGQPPRPSLTTGCTSPRISAASSGRAMAQPSTCRDVCAARQDQQHAAEDDGDARELARTAASRRAPGRRAGSANSGVQIAERPRQAGPDPAVGLEGQDRDAAGNSRPASANSRALSERKLAASMVKRRKGDENQRRGRHTDAGTLQRPQMAQSDLGQHQRQAEASGRAERQGDDAHVHDRPVAPAGLVFAGQRRHHRRVRSKLGSKCRSPSERPCRAAPPAAGPRTTSAASTSARSTGTSTTWRCGKSAPTPCSILLVGAKRRAFAVDAHRRVIEDYGQQEYDRTTYYEKWIRAIRNLMVEQEIVTREEIDAHWPRCAPGRRKPAARRPRSASRGEGAAQAGASAQPGGVAFRARRGCARHRSPALGHCRTPWYLRGKTGVVAAVHGTFRDPEQLAYHKPGLPAQVLYKVRFKQAASLGRLCRAGRRPSRGRHLRPLAGAGAVGWRHAHDHDHDHDDHDHDDHDHDHDHPHADRERTTIPVRSAPTSCWRRRCARC